MERPVPPRKMMMIWQIMMTMWMLMNHWLMEMLSTMGKRLPTGAATAGPVSKGFDKWEANYLLVFMQNLQRDLSFFKRIKVTSPRNQRDTHILWLVS